MYEIKTAQFEGPLDLLLGLIEKRKLSINDLSLGQIADDYVEHIKKFEDFPIEEVAVFVVIASTLMLIKSRSLMPGMELTEEEEQSIEELEERLRLHKRFQELSVHINKMFGRNPLFMREGFKGVEVGFIEPEGLTLGTLHNVLKEVLENLPVKECLPEVEVKKIISLEEKIQELSERLQSALEFSFSEFSTSRNDVERQQKKIEIVVSFLAVLELVKRGFIMAKQENLFDNINICKHE